MALVELGSTTLNSDANLQAYYKLENVNDSKNSNNLTNTGSTAFAAAKFNNGADFGASNSGKYLSSTAAIFNGNSAASISLWVKLQTEIGSGKYIFASHFSTSGADRYMQIGYEYNGGTRRLVGDFSGSAVNFTTTIAIDASIVNLVITRDVANNVGCLYLNGRLLGTTTLGSSTGGSTVISIGANSGGTNYSSAIIDDVAYFNRVLTQADINTINGLPTSHLQDQAYTSGQDNDDLGVGKHRITSTNNQIIGQSFKPSTTAACTQIAFDLKRIGSPDGNVWVELHADGADPTAASLLATSNPINATAGIGTGYDWIYFQFPTPPTLTSATTYWALLYGSSSYSTTNNVFLATDTTTPTYTNGSFGRYGNGGAAWETLTSYDLLFRQYNSNASPLKLTDLTANANNVLMNNGALPSLNVPSNLSGAKMSAEMQWDDMLIVPSSVSNSITGSFTIEGWMYIDTDGLGGVLMNKYGASPNYGYSAYIQGDESMIVNASTTGSANWAKYTASDAFPLSAWHHYAFVYDTSGPSITVYKDGVSVALPNTIGSVGASVFQTNDYLKIFSTLNAVDQNMRVADIRLWNTARSAGQVSANYQSYLVGNESGLVGNWQFKSTPPIAGVAASTLAYDANLRHLYRGEDLTDLVGGNNLTNNNSVAFNPGRFDNAFDLGTSNTTKYLNNTGFNANSNSFATAITISCWIKMKTDIPAGQYDFIYLGDNNTHHIGYEIIYIYNGGTPQLQVNRRKENVTNNFATYSSGFLGTTTFHHVVMTYDGSTLKLYVDNNSPATVATSGDGTAGNETNGFIIGRSRDNEATSFASAIIDDIALFDRALNASEVSTLFSSPLGSTGASFFYNFI